MQGFGEIGLENILSIMKSMQNINMVLGKICVMQLLEVIEDITSLLDTRR